MRLSQRLGRQVQLLISTLNKNKININQIDNTVKIESEKSMDLSHLERDVTTSVQTIVESIKDTVSRNLIEFNSKNLELDTETISAVNNIVRLSIEQASVNSSASLSHIFLKYNK